MLKFLCDRSGNEPGCPLQRRFSRKQQAIADRELDLLQTALRLVQQEGCSNLTMERLTKTSGYSKGTVYNHFCSKEDVIVALCNNALRQELAFYHKVQSYQGNSREKMLAMHLAYVTAAQLHPELFHCLLAAKSPFVQQKSSEARRLVQQQLEQEIHQLKLELMQSAIAEGSLKPPPNQSLALMLQAQAAQACGALLLQHQGQAPDKPDAFIEQMNLMLDALNWHPLSQQFNYFNTWQQLQTLLLSGQTAAMSSKVPHDNAGQ